MKNIKKNYMKNRVIRGIGAGVLGQIISLVGRVALVPLYISYWGQELYAYWILLSAVVAYLALADFGGQQYIVMRLTALRARNDREGFETVFQTALAFYVSISVALTILLIILLMAGLVVPDGKLQVDHAFSVRIVIGILGTAVITSLPLGLMLGLYRAGGHVAMSYMLTNFMLLAQILMQVAVLVLGGGMIAAASAQLLPQLALMTFVVRDLPFRYTEHTFFSIDKADLSLAKQFIRPSFQFFQVQIAFILSMQGLILIVGAIGSASEVVFFYAARMAANIVKQMLGVISHTVVPEFTRLDAIGGQDALARVFSVGVRVSVILALAIALVIVSFGQEIFNVWLGPEVKYDHSMVYLLFVWTGLSVYVYFSINLLLAVNDQRFVSHVMLPCMAFGLGASYILGNAYGIYGVIIGMASVELVIISGAIQIRVARRFPGLGAEEALAVIGPAAIILSTSWYSVEYAVAMLALWLIFLMQKYKDELVSKNMSHDIKS